MDDTHVCTPDQWGICTDPDRDWCPSCSRCTTWDADKCRECGAIWGEY